MTTRRRLGLTGQYYLHAHAAVESVIRKEVTRRKTPEPQMNIAAKPFASHVAAALCLIIAKAYRRHSLSR